MQLERLLHSQGFGSRKECRRLVRAHAVQVNGQPEDDPFCEVDPDHLEFSVNGASWRYRKQAYLMLHKPTGYECSRSPRHHAGVFDLLPAPLLSRGVQPAGRLDEDTTGLLLFSDDGQFIHRLISPRHKVPKRYVVTTRHPVGADLADALLAGVQLHDEPEPVRALACTIQGDHVVHLTLAEGKYHQVKRMVAAAGNRVEALHRASVGGLNLPDDLAPGQWRWLETEDLERLWNA